jgi:hypothetical protein
MFKNYVSMPVNSGPLHVQIEASRIVAGPFLGLRDHTSCPQFENFNLTHSILHRIQPQLHFTVMIKYLQSGGDFPVELCDWRPHKIDTAPVEDQPAILLLDILISPPIPWQQMRDEC